MGALADVAAKDLQDAGRRHPAGELGGVVVISRWRQAATPPVLRAGALLEHGGKPVVVAADLALGRLPHAHALSGAHRAVRGVGPVGGQRSDSSQRAWSGLLGTGGESTASVRGDLLVTNI